MDYPVSASSITTQTQFIPVVTYTIGSQAFTTLIPATFQAPTVVMVTTLISEHTTTLQILSGGAMTTPIVIPNPESITAVLDPTGLELSSKVTMISLQWMNLASAVEDWSRSPSNPAKETVVVEGIDRFVKDKGSVMGRAPAHDSEDKSTSCTRSNSGLPFIGDIFKTISCAINMASDIGNTFNKLITGSIDLRTKMAIQLAGMLDVIKFMANPKLNAPPYSWSA
jgi:membrane-associated protease RseP (regulator of RpoE activity)